MFVISILSFASIALADDFKTTDGKEYKDATVTHVEPDGIIVKTKRSITKLYFLELPKDVQERFHYDPGNATAYTAQQVAFSSMKPFMYRNAVTTLFFGPRKIPISPLITVWSQEHQLVSA